MPKLSQITKWIMRICGSIGLAAFIAGVLKNVPQAAVSGAVLTSIAICSTTKSRLTKALSYATLWLSIPAGIVVHMPSMWFLTLCIGAYFFTDYLLGEHPKRKWI